MDILIVGAGEMGRWFSSTFRPEEDTLHFTDIDPDVAQAAAREVGGSVFTADTNRPETFDIVGFAVPMPVTVRSIEEHGPNARGLVVDVSGVMAGPVEAMRSTAADIERLSLHPLFSAENSPGNIAVVRDNPGPLSEWLLDRLREQENTLIETTPAEHDTAMETVQAKAHTAVLAYALAADQVPDGFQTPISERLNDLASAVLSGNPRVYADIQSAFEGAEEVAEFATRIAGADHEEFERLYRQAQGK